jgi:hypothetical protein
MATPVATIEPDELDISALSRSADVIRSPWAT